MEKPRGFASPPCLMHEVDPAYMGLDGAAGHAPAQTGKENDMAEAAPEKPGQIRIRHTMLRVADLDRAVAFYTGRLGMRLMRRRDNDAERCAYVGYGAESASHALELIEERDRSAPITHGSGYGHVALGVPDIAAMCAGLKKDGVTFRQELQPAPSGKLRMAFILDPDGYEIELTERA